MKEHFRENSIVRLNSNNYEDKRHQGKYFTVVKAVGDDLIKCQWKDETEYFYRIDLELIKNKMNTKEIERYQKLTKFQKDVVDALKNLGFEHKYFSTYELGGWGSIEVDKFSRWSDVLKYVHEQGKDQKRFEMCHVLGL